MATSDERAALKALIDRWMGRYGSAYINSGETMARMEIMAAIDALAAQQAPQAMRAGALAALDEAFNLCANDPDHRLEVIRRLRDTIMEGE